VPAETKDTPMKRLCQLSFKPAYNGRNLYLFFIFQFVSIIAGKFSGSWKLTNGAEIRLFTGIRFVANSPADATLLLK
jgi:hypothetical protein